MKPYLINPAKQASRFTEIVNAISNYNGLIKIHAVKKKRTNNQNSYLHLVITLYAIEMGNTLEEMKTDLKRECQFMRYEKNGNHYLKSSADLDTKEMTDWIEWIKNKAGMQGIHLPSPDDYTRNWQEIEREIEAHKHYL